MTLKNSALGTTFHFATRMMLPMGLLVFTSCSSPPPAWNSKTAFSPSAYNAPAQFGGEIVTDSVSTTATVVSVDRTKRLVELKKADGTTITYKALPGAPGFDVIQAGDQVKVSVAEELAVFLGKNGVPASAGADIAKLRVRLPDGTLAAATEVGTLVFTAKIIAINDWDDSVTLQLAGGLTKTIKVGEFVNLADVSVGDTVSVKSSEAAVLLLEKP
ncbi:MAG: hypothetical protein WDM80_15845 [Limisphaerales bacterium]